MTGLEPTDSDDVRANSHGTCEDTPPDFDGANDETRSSPALSPSRAAVADRLATCDSVLEVGIGRRPGVAATLAARGVDVTAIDIRDSPAPDSVRFLRDDIVEQAARMSDDGSLTPTAEGENEGDAAHYRVDAVYALNLPPELQRPTRTVAHAVDAACLFTTLGSDPAIIPVTTASLGRETLYVARD